jgi:amino acid transporter
MCYTEFAVQLPVGGGAFSYVALTFGEFPAYITAAMLLMEYVLSGAAVARAFTSYLAALCNADDASFRVHTPHYELDFVAVGIIALLSLLLCRSTKESSTLNLTVTAVHVTIMVFIVVAGFVKGDVGNLSPFAPFGVRGVFDAATQVSVNTASVTFSTHLCIYKSLRVLNQSLQQSFCRLRA